jgi:hypothetical protein
LQFHTQGFGWLDRWQTLIAGLLGALAGFSALFSILAQMKLTAELDEGNRTRRNLADRASLSYPLSRLLGQQSIIIRSLAAAQSGIEGSIVPFKYGGFTVADEKDLQTLSYSVVDAPQKAADDISRLVSEIQVRNARLNDDTNLNGSETRDHEVRYNIEAFLNDSVFIYARAQRLLYYARRQDKEYNALNLIDSVQNTVFKHQLDGVSKSYSESLNRRLSRISDS